MAFHDAGERAEDRGATPAMTAVKHELRDWVEARLRRFSRNDDPALLTRTLNAALDAADLTCRAPTDPKRCMSGEFDSDSTGYLDGIKVELQDYGVTFSEHAPDQGGTPYGVFVVTTGMGILCGLDESAYVYEWSDNQLRRILDDEQSIAPGKPYTPQTIDAVQLASPSKQTGVRNVLVLGHEGWCSSNWYDTHHRIWRTTRDGKPALLLLSNATYSFLDNDPPIEGSINSKEALVEFRVNSLDVGVHSYETVRHYSLAGARPPRRIEPIALGPRAFTEEWLKADWTEAGAWSNPSTVSALRTWHGKLHADFLLGEFDDTMHCVQPDLWQVAIEFTDEDRKINDQQHYVGQLYFTVRWRPPYRFTMLGVSTTRAPSCREVDPQADEDRTLFPVQDWVKWK